MAAGKRKTKSDLVLATLAHTLQKAAGYVVLLLLTRHLPKEEVGAFFFALAIGVFLALVSDLGTMRYLTRETAADPGRAGDLLGRVLGARLMLIGACLLLVIGGTAAARPEMLGVMALTAAYVFVEDLFYTPGAALLGLGRVREWAVAMVASRVVLVGLVAAAVWAGAGLQAVIACHIVGALVLLAIGMAFVRRRLGPVRLRFADAQTAAVLRGCLPFFALTVLGLLHFKLDTVMLGLMQGTLAVATYEAAYKLLEVSRFLVRPAAMVYYPLCSALAARGSWGELLPLYRRMIALAAAAGAALALGVIALADVLMPLMYGDAYRDAAPTLRVLFLVTPLVFVDFITTFFAQSVRLEGRAIVLTAIAVAANGLINLVAIPLYGPIGAAWTTVATQSFLAVALAWMVLTRVKRWADEGRASEPAERLAEPTATVAPAVVAGAQA